ncbi:MULTISPECIES: LysR family transcriptional regulator [unclassified Leclercia]|uniref:LysR family transcriptional regulator n=1 Tax=Leclercia barmai TaxID=2785629 RepID=A0ABS7RVE3_9ENTR|nr:MULTISPECIES: LysR family transcriptional regulator [unclassified Leclercia]MBZ0057848.1 LysR family transcriptional regulator [Leclercia sp. EMC7]MCM5696384.1 LysR family transcriptional regulator [Leclercia sp. LTM01]MCM5700414.1 LysR family transcriptional regulator [Leclercia sp. LTM14]
MKNYSRSSTGIDLNLIPVFIEVVRCGSMAKASLRLDMSRPAVSLALKRFGMLFNEPLFTRKGLFLEPTPHALKLTAEMEKLLASIHDHIASTPENAESVPTPAAPERDSATPAVTTA